MRPGRSGGAGVRQGPVFLIRSSRHQFLTTRLRSWLGNRLINPRRDRQGAVASPASYSTNFRLRTLGGRNRRKIEKEMFFSHFTTALFFALIISVVFAVTSKDTDRERVLYGLWVFGLFLAISLGAAWLMYWIRG